MASSSDCLPRYSEGSSSFYLNTTITQRYSLVLFLPLHQIARDEAHEQTYIESPLTSLLDREKDKERDGGEGGYRNREGGGGPESGSDS